MSTNVGPPARPGQVSSRRGCAGGALSGLARATRARQDGGWRRGRVELVDRGRLVEELQLLRGPVARVVALSVVEIPERALTTREAENRRPHRVLVPPARGEVLVAAHELLVRESVRVAVSRSGAAVLQRRVVRRRTAGRRDCEEPLLQRLRRQLRP